MALPVASLRILISGASGLIGTELAQQLRLAGHSVFSFVRHEPRSNSEIRWDPSSGYLDEKVLVGADAVINLSGASLGRLPWSADYQKKILTSRLETTKTLVDSMGRSGRPPITFLCASAVGVYGDRPGVSLSDGSSSGDGFLADVVEAWEKAARRTPAATRLVSLRTGLVIATQGALQPLFPLTKLGLGARIGSGDQHWPWISLYDEAAAIRHLLNSSLSGPINLAGPVPATSERVTSTLARKLHRPHLFALPTKLVATGMGLPGRELLLASQKVIPSALLADGFNFRHPSVESAFDALFTR
ncbi:MAG: TIGR01777 family protein [Microbacteriaceae bacterium]|nr:TIGR01777 family protein [Microbacteriaceae bacterium]